MIPFMVINFLKKRRKDRYFFSYTYSDFFVSVLLRNENKETEEEEETNKRTMMVLYHSPEQTDLHTYY